MTEIEKLDQKSLYEEKMKHYIGSIPNSRFILEVTKFCGYSEFVVVFKNQSLLDVYKTISLQFECNDIKGLYLTNSVEHRIPITDNIRISDFISKSRNIMKPIYGMPLNVVYRIFIDDGHCCIDTVKLGDHI